MKSKLIDRILGRTSEEQKDKARIHGNKLLLKGKAIYVNSEELCQKVIEKLEHMGIIEKGSMSVSQLLYMRYIPDHDIIVSPLCLEVWYPEYEENLMYGDEFLDKY